jgi:membrane protease YdiL (CAAX protease family)
MGYKELPFMASEFNYPKRSLLTLACLLFAVVMLIPIERTVFGLPVLLRLVVGFAAALGFGLLWRLEPLERKRSYTALAVPLAMLVLSPISTNLHSSRMLILGACLASVIVIPPLILRRNDIITFKLWPDKLDWIDIFYTLLSIPLAWGGFKLYFKVFSPEVPYNWLQPTEPNTTELFKLFTGINAVGIWDELFFINICFAILRSLFPFRIANPAQAVIYTSVLYDMAFTGWGPVFVGVLALTQGVMFERSKALIWVLLVHLIVDYFLFQAIVEKYYPNFSVWWHF